MKLSNKWQEFFFEVLCGLLFFQLLLEFANELITQIEILYFGNLFIFFADLFFVLFAQLVLVCNFVITKFLIYFLLHFLDRKVEAFQIRWN